MVLSWDGEREKGKNRRRGVGRRRRIVDEIVEVVAVSYGDFFFHERIGPTCRRKR